MTQVTSFHFTTGYNTYDIKVYSTFARSTLISTIMIIELLTSSKIIVNQNSDNVTLSKCDLINPSENIKHIY